MPVGLPNAMRLEMRFTKFRCTLVMVGLFLLFSAILFAQSQSSLPDAPAPQANVPPPVPADVPPPAETPKSAPLPGSTKPAPQGQPGNEPVYAPGVTPSAGVETVPKGQQAPNTPGSGSDELAYMIKVSVDFVPVPVTVKDDDGHLVQGLLQRDFAVFENGQEQKISFFSSDPFPLSAAVVIDLGMPDSAVRKIKETLSALDGAFGPYDEISVYTYGNTVHKEQDFTNADAMLRTIKVLKQTARGENTGVPITSGPLASGPTINNKPAIEGTPHVQAVEQPSRVMNDAILQAALDLAGRPQNRRKVLFVISDGHEKGSRASYGDVMRVLLSKEVTVYGIGVDAAAIPVYRRAERVRIPGVGTGNILPRYASATGGDVFSEGGSDAIEAAYQSVTLEARNQYTLGYNTRFTASGTERTIEVRVHRPGLKVYAKQGYYPLPPAPAKPGAAATKPPAP
jgi:VWFA-related protein